MFIPGTLPASWFKVDPLIFPIYLHGAHDDMDKKQKKHYSIRVSPCYSDFIPMIANDVTILDACPHELLVAGYL